MQQTEQAFHDRLTEEQGAMQAAEQTRVAQVRAELAAEQHRLASLAQQQVHITEATERRRLAEIAEQHIRDTEDNIRARNNIAEQSMELQQAAQRQALEHQESAASSNIQSRAVQQQQHLEQHQ